jgi:hypothetical protein
VKYVLCALVIVILLQIAGVIDVSALAGLGQFGDAMSIANVIASL